MTSHGVGRNGRNLPHAATFSSRKRTENDVSSGAGQEPKHVEYRQRAAECRALADDVSHEATRKELLDLARVWMSLAQSHSASPAP